VFLQAGYQVFFFEALAHHVSPGLLTIILGMQPILTAVVGKEHTTKAQWVGLSFGMIGLILVVADSLFIVNISIIGISCAVLSMLSMTVGTFLQKHTTTSQPANMAIQYTGSAILLTILAAGVEHFTVHWTVSFAFALGWMVLIVSVGATMLLYFMIRKRALTNVTSVFYGVPPVTALLDFVIFGHALHAVTILGMGLIILGLISINRRETK
jgi:drug/metabolite transporter (DMT)-like permease